MQPTTTQPVSDPGYTQRLQSLQFVTTIANGLRPFGGVTRLTLPEGKEGDDRAAHIEDAFGLLGMAGHEQWTVTRDGKEMTVTMRVAVQ